MKQPRNAKGQFQAKYLLFKGIVFLVSAVGLTILGVLGVIGGAHDPAPVPQAPVVTSHSFTLGHLTVRKEVDSK